MLFVALALMLDGGAAPSSAQRGNGRAKVTSEDRVRHFMRQHRIDRAIERPLDIHLPTKDFASIEHEAGHAASAEIGAAIWTVTGHGRAQFGIGLPSHSMAKSWRYFSGLLPDLLSDLLRRGGHTKLGVR